MMLKYPKVSNNPAIKDHVEQLKEIQLNLSDHLLHAQAKYKKVIDRYRLDSPPEIHYTSLDSSINEAFLQHQCIMTWDKCGGSHFTHYTTHVAPNYV